MQWYAIFIGLVSEVYAIFITVWFRLCGFCYIFYSLVNIVYACYIYYSLVYVACAKCTFIAARCICVIFINVWFVWFLLFQCMWYVIFIAVQFTGYLLYFLQSGFCGFAIFYSVVYILYAIIIIVQFLLFLQYLLQSGLCCVCYILYSLRCLLSILHSSFCCV